MNIRTFYKSGLKSVTTFLYNLYCNFSHSRPPGLETDEEQECYTNKSRSLFLKMLISRTVDSPGEQHVLGAVILVSQILRHCVQ